jgi:hypothetical protein
MVAVVALAWTAEASVPAALVRLNAIAVSTSQAELAANTPEGKVRQWPILQVGDDLLDDGLAAVVGFDVQHRKRRVSEPGVVSPGLHRVSSPDPVPTRTRQEHRRGIESSVSVVAAGLGLVTAGWRCLPRGA